MTTTTIHAVEIDFSPADALDTAAYAWFCTCGGRGEWRHVGADDLAGEAYDQTVISGRQHGASPEPSNADPVDGTTNVDGAVWGEGRWHLVKILPVFGVRHDGDQAVCSCEWEGIARKGTYSYTVATEDAERHTWSVSHR